MDLTVRHHRTQEPEPRAILCAEIESTARNRTEGSFLWLQKLAKVFIPEGFRYILYWSLLCVFASCCGLLAPEDVVETPVVLQFFDNVQSSDQSSIDVQLWICRPIAVRFQSLPYFVVL